MQGSPKNATTKVDSGFAALETYLQQQGPGSQAIIAVDRSAGPGHFYNAFNNNGAIMYEDGQSGDRFASGSAEDQIRRIDADWVSWVPIR